MGIVSDLFNTKKSADAKLAAAESKLGDAERDVATAEAAYVDSQSSANANTVDRAEHARRLAQLVVNGARARVEEAERKRAAAERAEKVRRFELVAKAATDAAAFVLVEDEARELVELETKVHGAVSRILAKIEQHEASRREAKALSTELGISPAEYTDEIATDLGVTATRVQTRVQGAIARAVAARGDRPLIDDIAGWISSSPASSDGWLA